MAEIEERARELRRKAARFALFCAVESSDEAAARVNAAAVTWMQETLEDIAATALGMETAFREALLHAHQVDFLRASEADKQVRPFGREDSI
ncbi:hypothetical protein ACFRJ8_19940 [Arthrobacter sp. NPDC056886]|uniref:hypothetical protein n=1 Tax=Arthrobacter sp. NPDC056886 TaxID=3345960 RepID=UPI0036705C05